MGLIAFLKEGSKKVELHSGIVEAVKTITDTARLNYMTEIVLRVARTAAYAAGIEKDAEADVFVAALLAMEASLAGASGRGPHTNPFRFISNGKRDVSEWAAAVRSALSGGHLVVDGHNLFSVPDGESLRTEIHPWCRVVDVARTVGAEMVRKDIIAWAYHRSKIELSESILSDAELYGIPTAPGLDWSSEETVNQWWEWTAHRGV
jgi:hypothetical protein